ncbi:MAG: aspartate-semialdehyde dehydrogenase [Spirochaeta sp.]|jgi:aspartate-semialdehyde dehydrogenase|nr:aspartate-semialdehyde dehydrogenase [Spirochaeta sp.]
MNKQQQHNDFYREHKIGVGVMGATGAVGQSFMWMLHDHPWFEVKRVMASEKRVGRNYGEDVHWILPMEIPPAILDYTIESFDVAAMKRDGIQIVFSALPTHAAQTAERELIEAGMYVFSNAAALRYDEHVPILIPEANIDHLRWIEAQGYPDKGFGITNANCSTTGLAVAMAPLMKYGVRDLVVSTYQSVSGAGHPGLSALDITNNVIPFIDQEEEKMTEEFRKILSVDFDIFPYCVRVPVMFGHLESVWVEFEQEVDLDRIITDWHESSQGLEHLPSTPLRPIEYETQRDLPQAKQAFYGFPQGMVVYTGRLKRQGHRIGFNLLVNNVIKGAAGGSIQNAEAFVARYLDA